VLEVTPQPTHLETDDGVCLRIEGLVAPEGIERNGVGLEAAGPPGHSLLHEIAEKPLPLRTGAEGAARDDTRKRFQNAARGESGAIGQWLCWRVSAD
jgi:hypothetical protein